MEQVVKQLLINLSKQHETLVSELVGTTEDQLYELSQTLNQSIPSDVEILLRFANGGLQLHESFKTLSTDRIAKDNEINSVSAFWKKNYLTIAQDNQFNYLLVEKLLPNTESTGRVVSWNNDEGVQDELGDNLYVYLERLTKAISEKDVIFSEGKGFVESN